MKTKKVLLFLLLLVSLFSVFMISSFAITTGVINGTDGSLNMRNGPGKSHNLVIAIPNGTVVTINSTVACDDGSTTSKWYNIDCVVNSKSYTGYVSSARVTNVTTTDEKPGITTEVPSMYKSYIDNLKTLHPNWNFQFFNTGLDWNEVIKNEAANGRSAIAGSNPISYRSTTLNYTSGDSWYISTKTDPLKIRTGPGTTYNEIVRLPKGSIVNVIEEVACNDGTDSVASAYYKITFKYNGTSYTGYGAKQYISKSIGSFTPVDGSSWYQAHGQVIRYYMDPRNLLNENNVFQFERLSYDSANHTLSGVEAILKGTFMANTLIETDKFVYETVSGDASGDNELSIIDVKLVLQYCSQLITFNSTQIKNYDFNGDGNVSIVDAKIMLNNIASGDSSSSTNGHYETITYAEAIIRAAQANGVSPYHLASRIIQEVGVNGSRSTSGKDSTYPGIYNFYNIGATAASDPILNGLNWASQSGTYGRPWTTPYKSIMGGASFIANGYINVGQDTLYFQKFSVVNSNYLYWHQYMANIQAPTTEASKIKKGYIDMGIIDSNFVFVIPVYKNMPSSACQLPASSSSPNLDPDY